MEYVFLFLSALASLAVNAVGFLRRREVRRILVFKPDHLGDLVTATPALDYLRRRYPAAEITAVVGPWVLPLVEDHPAVDRCVAYASPRFRREPSPGRSVPLREIVPPGPYDLIVGLRDDWATLRFSLLAGASRRRDRGTVRLRFKLLRLLRGTGLGPPARSLHEVETNLRIVGADPAAENAIPRLRLSVEAREWAVREVGSPFEERGGYVVLHPGAYSPLRRWPGDRFAAVARAIRDENGLGVVITGSRAEAGLAAEIAGLSGPGVRSLAGETTLRRAAAAIAGARAMVSLDTGLMHVATAVGTPVVALVGPEDPERFGPYGPDAITLYHNLPCSPCDQVHCVRRSNECMEAITVAEVLEAVSLLLTRRRKP